MLRQKLRQVLVEERLRSRLSKLLNLATVIGILWILSGPWIAKKVFTSENALRQDRVQTSFDTDKLTVEVFDRIKADLEAIPQGKNKTVDLTDYISGHLSKFGEVHTQPLRTVGWGNAFNMYSYLRSKDGYGQECIVLTAPFEYDASVAYLLTFVELMGRRQPEWQSKDILVLFYPESDYVSSVREFLDAYYGVDGHGNPVGSL